MMLSNISEVKFKFLDIGDIAYNQPKGRPYLMENPWS